MVSVKTLGQFHTKGLLSCLKISKFFFSLSDLALGQVLGATKSTTPLAIWPVPLSITNDTITININSIQWESYYAFYVLDGPLMDIYVLFITKYCLKLLSIAKVTYKDIYAMQRDQSMALIMYLNFNLNLWKIHGPQIVRPHFLKYRTTGPRLERPRTFELTRSSLVVLNKGHGVEKSI